MLRKTTSDVISRSYSYNLHRRRASFSSSSCKLAVTNEVLNIIEQISPMEPALEKVVPFLTREVVASVIEEKKKNLELGFRFFIWAMKNKRLRSRASHSLIVDMLVGDNCSGKSGHLDGFELYWRIFDEVRKRVGPMDSAALAVLISAYWKIKNAEKAVETFGKMREFDCTPDLYVYNIILHVVVKKDVILLALALYNMMLKSNCRPNCSTFNILIHGLCKSGKTQDALHLFDEMRDLGLLPNKTTYTMILLGLCQAKRTDDAHRLFNLMKTSGCLPDNVTYNALLNGFCKLGRVDEAFALLKSFTKDGYAVKLPGYSCLVDGLIRARRIDEAHELFQKLFEIPVIPDRVLYTTMMRGLSQAGRLKDALNLLKDMTQRGVVPDTQCYNTLIKGFCDIGLLDQARSLQLEISRNDLFPDTCTYTVLICALCENGMVREAQNIFDEMEKIGCFPSVVTFNSLIHGLCMSGLLEKAHLMFYRMEIGKNPSLFLRLSQGADRVLDSASLQTMVEKLCDSGSILKAYKLLMQLADSGVVPNVITYNILINGLCKGGNLNGAFKLFEELQLMGHSPDKITYGTLIDGLQMAGREEDAFKLFEQMSNNGCTPGPEVYKSLMTWACRKMKTSLASSIWLKYMKAVGGEANEKIGSIEKHFEEGNLEMAVKGILEIDFQSVTFDSAPYNIWLIGLCQAQRTEEALKVFSILEELSINISAPGCVMLIQSLCNDGKLDQAISIFLYTLEKGIRLMPRICNNLLTMLLHSQEKAEDAFYLLKEMKSMGYNFDSYLYKNTKSLLIHHRYRKVRKLESVSHG
ncbi:pentatricopeptide repeat-containing protein At1g79540 [Coffea arabica]|uniref:Pentatricopeptide repeat-containing protein At1g79540 n=1 Tax=Coffea arabica TaxID=13443 RepID=A0A6P6SZI7_COFAR|nr:pentatricopeptide repeat-containing protein At1g79540-like [Coffea arabica]XP_027071462.1 pentatricopeptide repeat-containing protein At1g79540-like [Coffea arabica]XP_027071463.1 pentatricopeptide repeat-containing protein At1g79540-like [Coffea arabica]XP_027071464.1 pentatricopeptide repeat-containing protein At1g79540-like [Coffea arabica]XP_027071465.1 pentatricopeptide repeat-containing protein At1g79540-like [Coffea arabica]XP_027071466.1 pentatricopeptide repeat-containing protein A